MLESLYREGGLTFIVIIGLSIVSLAVGLERFASTFSYRRRLDVSTERILAHLREGNRTMARAVNETLPWHPAAELFNMLLADVRSSAGELKRTQARLVRAARRRLWVLASIGSLAPFVGLFGTVLGVMESFQQIGEQGAGGFQVVSGGISEALIATAGGIFVGIEAVLLFNYLQVYIGEYTTRIREAAEEILEASSEAERGPASAQAG